MHEFTVGILSNASLLSGYSFTQNHIPPGMRRSDKVRYAVYLSWRLATYGSRTTAGRHVYLRQYWCSRGKLSGTTLSAIILRSSCVPYISVTCDRSATPRSLCLLQKHQSQHYRPYFVTGCRSTAVHVPLLAAWVVPQLCHHHRWFR